jgi:hypothetical protein
VVTDAARHSPLQEEALSRIPSIRTICDYARRSTGVGRAYYDSHLALVLFQIQIPDYLTLTLIISFGSIFSDFRRVCVRRDYSKLFYGLLHLGK